MRPRDHTSGSGCEPISAEPFGDNDFVTGDDKEEPTWLSV
jgi:hypothetical protein